MKGDLIPDHNSIARYCKPTHAPDGQIQATAFMLRADEESLSVNWLEFLNCSDRDSEIVELQNVYNAKFKRVGARAKIAVINVGAVRERVLSESPDRRIIMVLHDPQKEDPSHSGIHNLKADDELIAELILETVCETYPARK